MVYVEKQLFFDPYVYLIFLLTTDLVHLQIVQLCYYLYNIGNLLLKKVFHHTKMKNNQVQNFHDI